MPGKPSSKALLLDFLLANLGRVIETRELQKACGFKAEFGRRLRELRDEEGYEILTNKDRADLKMGQYLMLTDKRRPAFARGISRQTRALVLERNGYTCAMCGYGAGDEDPLHPGRKVRLTMGHIVDKSKGGDDTPSNLRAICTNCNEGLQNLAPPKPALLHLLSQLRKAPIEDQRGVLNWLLKKFGLKLAEAVGSKD